MIRVGLNTSAQEELRTGTPLERILDFSAPAARLAKRGVRHIELSFDIPVFFDEDATGKALERMIAMQLEYGFTCTVHLPFRGIDYCYPSPHVRAGMANMLAALMSATAPLSPRAYVLHPAGPMMKSLAGVAADSPIFAQFLDSFLQLIGSACARSLTPPKLIALENISFPFFFNRAVLDALPISLCVDVGHVWADKSGDGLELGQLFDQYGSRIANIHLHDVNAHGRDHLPFGVGLADIGAFAAFLKRTDYSGAVVLEMKCTEEEKLRCAFELQALLE